MKNNRHFTDALFEEFDFFNDEVDNLLVEDLDTMLKYYNNLQNWDRQELLNFLTKDPTWNNNKEQGQYSKWVLDKLNRNLLNSSHLGHLYDVLQRFEDNKKHLKNKDINKFRSIQEIDTYLNDDNNYNELSHSQIVRQHRRDKQRVDLGNEAELIYEDPDWEIWIPKTYAASCKLGQGSKWCTASTETSSYFNRYSKKGPLYIILNKHNEKEKYQFHFETDSYMDINDKSIELSDFCEDEHTEKIINVLRQYNKNFDERCKYLETFNNFLEKINSLEIIKYPTQKDIIEDFQKSIFENDNYKSLTQKELSKIKDIKLEIENSIEKLEPYTFNNITWITKVFFEKNSKLRSIGDSAFERCENLESIEIPNSVTSIGEYAFYNCYSLKSVTIPDSVTSIKIGNSVTSIKSFAFGNCVSLASVEIPNSITSIGSRAFYYCGSLESIKIPDSVTSIEEFAFYNCTNLDGVVIPNSVTSIGSNAFWGCASLINIEIPNSVTSIGKDIFLHCPKAMWLRTSNPYVIDYCIENNIKYEKID